MRAKFEGRRLPAAFLGGALVFVACGSLEDGTINVVDGASGAPADGGADPGGGAGDTGTAEGGQTGGGQGGSAGAEGEAGSTTEGGSPGTSGGAGEGGSSEPAGGAPSGGGAGAAGEAGGTTLGCANGCDGTTPICEPPDCRACASDEECETRDANTPICATDGACSECVENEDCPEAGPVCDEGVCRDCVAHAECATLACDLVDGTCVSPAAVVYALAQDGSAAASCGSLAEPCSSMQTAADKLSASRAYLVLVPTENSFAESVVLPDVAGLTLIGHDVLHAPTTGEYVFRVNSGSSITIDGVRIVLGTPDYPVGITCSDSDLLVKQTQVSGAEAGIGIDECNLTVQDSLFTNNSQHGITDCYLDTCPAAPEHDFQIERSEFRNNRVAIRFEGASYVIRNNIFFENGFDEYAETVRLESNVTPGLFAYNTLVGNENGCTFVGIVLCAGAGAGCGNFSSNLAWNNNQASMCPDQTFYMNPNVSNTLAEMVWPGSGNLTGDPLLDATTFEPGAGSPALGGGDPDPSIMPSVDFYGNPRPQGDGPEIGAVEAN